MTDHLTDRHADRRTDPTTDPRYLARSRRDASAGWRDEYEHQGVALPDGGTTDHGGRA